MIHLDTHVVVWMWQKNNRRLSSIKAIINREDLEISPAVTLELQALYEIGRMRHTPNEIVPFLAEAVGLTVAATPFDEIVSHALSFSWTGDPFDRLIVANALACGVRLLTFDETILANYRNTVAR